MRHAVIWAARNVWLAWVLCVPVLWQLIDWSLDRHPPFALMGSPGVVSGRAGETVVYIVRVRRDLDRDCAVQWQRHVIDSQSVRHDFAGRFEMSGEELRSMAESMGPNWLRLAVDVPAGSAPGRAVVVTPLRYYCNPLHRWWPIAVTTTLPLEVLP